MDPSIFNLQRTVPGGGDVSHQVGVSRRRNSAEEEIRFALDGSGHSEKKKKVVPSRAQFQAVGYSGTSYSST
ncbi:unnamed protein product [Nezara viridula]|uniref:Uncharacterized protein n=1 Tax=Nezara viridula TaxID=85310 RepID=A0A9P0MS67_NEZVI|nr:unnamed protein product [Nezara viridula]